MSKRRNQSLSGLQLILFLGSTAATFIGGTLLARQPEPAAAAEPVNAIVVPAAEGSSPVIIDLAPIPQAEIPQPVARARSSG